VPERPTQNFASFSRTYERKKEKQLNPIRFVANDREKGNSSDMIQPRAKMTVQGASRKDAKQETKVLTKK